VRANAPVPVQADDLERDTDLAIALCGGDARATVRALLVANAFLETELARAIAAGSKGYARRGTSKGRTRQGSD
jgi:hypothetical protein